jgi:5-methylcytosine-specific restriction endonuclease McrA
LEVTKAIVETSGVENLTFYRLRKLKIPEKFSFLKCMILSLHFGKGESVKEQVTLNLPNLPGLSNHDLVMSLKYLFENERKISRSILLHLKEINRRKLYADRGYPNLFKMLISEFKLSESSANRRIKAMLLLSDVPEFEKCISSGELNLSTLSMAQKHIRIQEKLTGQKLEVRRKAEIVEQIKNKTQAEAEVKLMQLLPEAATCPKTIEKRISESEVRLSINMPDRLKNKLKRLQELWAHQNPKMDYIELIEKSVDRVLEREDPMLRKSRSKKLNIEPQKPSATAAVAPDVGTIAPLKRQYLPIRIRALIHKNADSRCEYVDELTQHRCASRFLLETDHIIPVAKGGSNEVSNLRILCKTHNLLMARRHFGNVKRESESQS